MSVALAAVIGQVLTFLTVIAGFLFQYIREARRHQWDTEREVRMTTRIEAGTDAAKAAYTEANDVNKKIAMLGHEILGSSGKSSTTETVFGRSHP